MYTKHTACLGSSPTVHLLHHQCIDWVSATCLMKAFVILKFRACWCFLHLVIRDCLLHLHRGHCYTVHLSTTSRANLAKAWRFLSSCFEGMIFLRWLSCCLQWLLERVWQSMIWSYWLGQLNPSYLGPVQLKFVEQNLILNLLDHQLQHLIFKLQIASSWISSCLQMQLVMNQIFEFASK